MLFGLVKRMLRTEDKPLPEYERREIPFDHEYHNGDYDHDFTSYGHEFFYLLFTHPLLWLLLVTMIAVPLYIIYLLICAADPIGTFHEFWHWFMSIG